MKEFSAFRVWLIVNELPTHAIVLWHTLMNVNNSFGGKSTFNLPNGSAQILTGLSKSGVFLARKRLAEHGLIKYKPGGKGKSPVYEMISLVKNEDEFTD